MCGIAGFAGPAGAAGRGAVGRMIEALARRGPDGEGISQWPRAVLGHRRLAIFDLSDAGRQPMLTPDGRIGVVFNGAVYNFKALRRELEGRGFSFRTATDTEVLLHGYREWGIEELVRRLRGMFAFALWDDERGTLHLVRDRLGVKPLIFTETPHGIYFASTVRAFRAAGLVDALDPEAVADFLRDGYVPDSRAIYRGLEKVPAATILTWAAGTRKSVSYWSPMPDGAAAPTPSFEEAIEETERLLLEAVRLRLQADVPVGVLLSSGIDSSLVCWAVAKLGADITAFTVGVPGDPWDETAGALRTARALGIRHELLPLSETSMSSVSELVEAYGEPFGCASALGMLAVSRAVSEQATVLLTGDGGDDVFLGYPRDRHLLIAQQIARRLPGFAASGWTAARKAIPAWGPLRRLRSLGDYATEGYAAFRSAGSSLRYYHAEGLLGPKLLRAEPDASDAPRGGGATALSDYLAHAYRTQFVGEYMTKVDGATMHFALEARAPFLDQELWSFATRLPPELRLRGYRLKAVLRELASRRIGPEIAHRKKRGFGVPTQRWLAGRWSEEALAVWQGAESGNEGWVDAARVRGQLQKARALGTAPLELWYLLVFELWLRREREFSAAEAKPSALATR